MESTMTQQNSSGKKDAKKHTHNVAVPVEVQIQMAETRRALAKARYELSVRKGRSWAVSPDTK